MRRITQFALSFALLLPCAAQQVIDRMVAVVNNQVITQSDWDEQERFEALAEGRNAGAVQHSPAALERLIDRVLISEHLSGARLQHATPEDVSSQIAAIRKQLPPAQSQDDAAWRKTLAEYSIPEEDLAQIVAEQVDVLRFVEIRFRPNVQVSPEELESYYNKTFLPELKKAGTGDAELPKLKQVEDRIRQVLVEQRVNEILNSWVQSLRAQANIRRIAPTTIESSTEEKASAKQ
jgi:peptidyl-prolyl cis-trans isomerase SurA